MHRSRDKYQDSTEFYLSHQLKIKPNIQMYKKNTVFNCSANTYCNSKLIRIMRLLSILMFVTIMQVSASSLAQNINMQLKNVRLEEAFVQLQKQSGYDFLYSSQLLKSAIPVTTSLKGATIEEAMEKLMSNQPFTYVINKKTITIKAKPQPPKPIQINGKVTDEENEPLIGVSIRIKNTQTGTISDEKGSFSLNTTEKNISLVFKYMGFEEKEVPIDGNNPLNVVLKKTTSKLEEIVVIGYGEVKKRDLTGAVSVVNTKDIEDVPGQRVDQMLQGRIAGAEIVSTSGEPGAETSIRIRGTRSISATNEPLYVVDGVMDAVDSMNDINPNDIESIQVLKDASSTAIYGSRGANGVILITTKRGKEGVNEYMFRSTIGISQIPRYLDLMNAQDFAELLNDVYYFSNTANQIKPIEDYPFPRPADRGEGTNWTKEITRTAPTNSHTFTASGGNRSTKYFFSGNYSDNQGIIINSGLKRYQARLNLDQTFSKHVKGGINLNYSFIEREFNKADIGTQTLWYTSTLFLSPIIPAYKADGSLNDWNSQWYEGQIFNSPLANSLLQKKDSQQKSLSPNFFLEVTPTKGLKIRSSVSFHDHNRFDDTFYPSTLPTRANAERGAYAYKRAYRTNNILNENTITYNKSWNKKHNFEGLYGFTVQKSKYVEFNASGDGYLVDDLYTNDLRAIPSKENTTLTSDLNERGRLSHLTRLNYNYDSKYYFTFTGRYDAASNFAANNKWALFPSAALKWNLKSEDFLKNIDFINNLSLRASAGISGNDAIGMYQSLSRYSSSTSNYIFDGVIPVSYFPARVPNPNLTWEKTKQINFGLDLTVLKNKVDLTVEYYSSRTNDLLVSLQLPTQGGYTSRLTNFGETSNSGIEASLTTKIYTRKLYFWNSTFTIAHNTQKVIDVGTFDRIATYTNPYGAQYMMYGYEAGRPLNALWGMQYAGTWKNQEEINQNQIDKKYVSSSTAYYEPGRQRYIDQNNDGLLDNNDLVYLGNADPIVYGGLQNSIRLKNWWINIYFNYSLGGKIYNPTELFMGTGTSLTNQYKYMENRWHPVRNPNSNIPRASSKDDIPNDRFVYDASFLRLKSASASYVFHLSKLTHNKLRELHLTAAGSNLFLLKKYNGYDPEVSTQSGGSTIRRMDNGAYPNSRMLTFTATLKF